MTHNTVLLHEVVDGLAIEPGDVIVDGTLGGGGHSAEIARIFDSNVKIIGLDLDEDALVRAKERLDVQTSNTSFHHASFRNLDEVLSSLHISQVNRIILDLGLSSHQFEVSGRGFSFKRDEPLLMTFRKELSPSVLTAREIVNEWDETNLADVIYGYGEERFARRIARAIVEARQIAPIETTTQLVGIIEKATPAWYHHRKINPATKTFQALRIAVNDELESLKAGMKKGFEALAPRGRMAIISFHSLEDRIVKNFYKEMAQAGRGILITKRPITPTEIEIIENPRARSSKLRIIQKI